MITELTLCFQYEHQTKADKIKLALQKLKEAKVRKVKSAVFFYASLSSKQSYAAKVTDPSAPPSW